MSQPSFEQLRVLAFESRRHAEIATLIRTFGGRPISAPAMREVPLEQNVEARDCLAALLRGEVDVVITLTGVGLRAVLEVADHTVGRTAFVDALRAVRVAARGPKPLAVLRELGITPWVVAPSPNTSHELLAALDAAGADTLHGARVVVQEYGTSSAVLLDGLRHRGAIVTRLPVYRYGLPEDLEPLRAAVTALAQREVDVVLFTTATQVVHLLQVAAEMGMVEQVRAGLAYAVVASIGPTTSEELREQGLRVDLDASQPKMGLLVRDAAVGAPAIRRSRSATTPGQT